MQSLDIIAGVSRGIQALVLNDPRSADMSYPAFTFCAARKCLLRV
jgi:hypothetical protein